MWALRFFPLFGRVANAKSSSLKASLAETLIGTLFSTLPIWFFPVFISNLIKGGPLTSELILSSVKRGDLFIYSAALMGPLIYTITRNYAELAPDEDDGVDDGEIRKEVSAFRRLTFEFPYGPTFVIVAIIICMIAAICYGVANLSGFPGTGFIVSEDFLVTASIWVYVFSLICLFAVSTYREELSNLNKNLPQDERDFFKRWKHRTD